jgi:hypothetical protein
LVGTQPDSALEPGRVRTVSLAACCTPGAEASGYVPYLVLLTDRSKSSIELYQPSDSPQIDLEVRQKGSKFPVVTSYFVLFSRYRSVVRPQEVLQKCIELMSEQIWSARAAVQHAV